MTMSDDPLYKEVGEVLEGFKKRMIDRIEKGQQKQKACKIKNVIESKMALELKLNAELKARLSELSKRGDELDRICSNFASGLTISDSDQNRLDNAKEMYEIGKHLTGIRFDFSAPPDVAKGYIKCERRRALCPFEESTLVAPERLWTLLSDTWQPAQGKENVQPECGQLVRCEEDKKKVLG